MMVGIDNARWEYSPGQIRTGNLWIRSPYLPLQRPQLPPTLSHLTPSAAAFSPIPDNRRNSEQRRDPSIFRQDGLGLRVRAVEAAADGIDNLPMQAAVLGFRQGNKHSVQVSREAEGHLYGVHDTSIHRFDTTDTSSYNGIKMVAKTGVSVMSLSRVVFSKASDEADRLRANGVTL